MPDAEVTALNHVSSFSLELASRWSTREMGLHGSHGRWRCRPQRSSMEMSPAVVFDSFSREKGLHGSHGRWRCRRQRALMEILTAEKGFDGSHGRWRRRRQRRASMASSCCSMGFMNLLEQQ
ncbi:hypothetical protein Dimus_004334 [Dionaea muscipula]